MSREIDMAKVKDLVNRYYKAYVNSKDLAKAKERLVKVLKESSLTKTKFEFDEGNIVYHKYEDNEGITQKLIKKVLVEHYPSINSEEFMNILRSSRERKTVETIKFITK